MCAKEISFDELLGKEGTHGFTSLELKVFRHIAEYRLPFKRIAELNKVTEEKVVKIHRKALKAFHLEASIPWGNCNKEEFY